jgi:hypothetical protein
MDLSGKTIEELREMERETDIRLAMLTRSQIASGCGLTELADRREIRQRIDELQNQVTYADYIDDVQRSI